MQQPPVFSGNHFDYAAFISAFNRMPRRQSKAEAVLFKPVHIPGDAKESIQDLIILDSPDSYDKARNVLKERFRHPYRIALAYKEKLNTWPPIKEGDGVRLQQFAGILMLCEQAMKTKVHGRP